MLYDLINNIFATTKGVLAGQVVDGRLNPVRLAIATTGYRIQSRTLHIPDHMGLFSSGPPRRQVHEATDFIVLVFFVCLTSIGGGSLVLFIREAGLPGHRKLGALIALITVLGVAFLWWGMVFHDRHRAPGYEFPDWKLRNE